METTGCEFRSLFEEWQSLVIGEIDKACVDSTADMTKTGNQRNSWSNDLILRFKRQFFSFPIRRWTEIFSFFSDLMRLQFKFDFYCVIERNHVRPAEERMLFARSYCRWSKFADYRGWGEANKGEVQTCAGWSATKITSTGFRLTSNASNTFSGFTLHRDFPHFVMKKIRWRRSSVITTNCRFEWMHKWSA